MSSFKRRLLAAVLFLVLLVGLPVVMIPLMHQKIAPEGVMSLNRSVEAPFLEPLPVDTVVMFFGYVGCSDVCTPLLMHLQHWYRHPELQEIKVRFQVVFVNLTPKATAKQAAQFAAAFEADFVGIHLDRAAIKKIDRGFDLYHAPSLSDVTALNHSDYVYVLQREHDKIWTIHEKYIPHPLNQARLRQKVLMLSK